MSSTTDHKIDASAGGEFLLGGDLRINRMGFGAMRLTGEGIWGAPRDRGEAVRVAQHVLDLGINFIDTADAYGPDVSEEILAEALHPYPAGVVIATKGGLTRGGPGDWSRNGHPDHLRQALDGSLKRLQLDVIDVYQFHRIDPAVPLEESLGTLVDLQREGKIRHIGVSNFDVGELTRGLQVATIVSVQNRYNMTDRSSDDVLQLCEQHGIGFIPWAPLADGEATRPGGPLDRIAHAHGATQGQIALAWLLHRSPVMLPIPGTSSIAHLDENTAAVDIRLGDDEMHELMAL